RSSSSPSRSAPASAPPSTAPPSTTRTSASRRCSSGCPGGTSDPHDHDERSRPAGGGGRPAGRSSAPQPIPHLVLPAGRDPLHDLLPGPDVRLVLLQPHPLEPVRVRVHRAGELRPVLPGTGPGHRVDQHDHLRGRDLGPQGRARAAVRRAADLADHRPRVPAFRGVLPGAGQPDRRRDHLPGADGPVRGPINEALAAIGIPGPGWLTDPSLALLSVALVDVWKGVGLATVIYMAGIVSIPQEYFEAARVDGAGPLHQFRHVLLPLARPATVTVIILSLIGGLRSFDLIWAMTRGGPGFTSDVIASVIYKQYQAGFYGLSTAGNVILFLLVTAIVLPLS